MDISLHHDLGTLGAALLAVPVYSDEGNRGEAFAMADKAVGGLLSRLADEEKFEGKPGQQLLVHTLDSKVAARMCLVGLGKATEAKAPSARAAATVAVQEANARKLGRAACLLPDGIEPARAVRHATEGVLLGAYRYDTFLTVDVEPQTCESVAIVTGGRSGLDDAVALGRAISEGVILARDLVNGPPIEVTPLRMAEVAHEIAAAHGLEIEVFDKKEITARGMNLLLAVNAGSDIEPRFIHLTYRPEGATDETPSIALVGKGLTYDAGGYNLKPTGSLEDMKIDMAGGAAVLGAMKAIKALAPPFVVHGIVPSTENLVSGSAYKPGDIIRSMNGKSVEVMNTDAEGRLILADALCFTERMGVDRIIDLATLTGACMVALGPHTAGLFCDDDEFAGRMLAASEAVGEHMWRMPLTPKLRPMLKSPSADMKNVGPRWGGAITAGLFLKEFVGDRTWLHLDIAGPVWADKADGYVPKGGTGFAVMSLLELLSGETL
jgi:leucyl aminopeptidase